MTLASGSINKLKIDVMANRRTYEIPENQQSLLIVHLWKHFFYIYYGTDLDLHLILKQPRGIPKPPDFSQTRDPSSNL